MRRAIILFTRIPVPGKTKTRMMPYFNGKQCAVMHRCFLQDLMETMRQVKADLFLCYTGQGDLDRVEKWAEKTLGLGLICYPQRGDDLGARMYNSMAQVLAQGYDSCLLVGSDIPELTAKHLEDAFDLLTRKDLVLGPTRDGGYYLVGTNKPQFAIFEGQTYSHDQVFHNAIKAGKAAGLSYGRVGTLSDVDTPEDYKALCKRWQKPEGQVAAFIRRFASVSVIVPIYNEETTILALQDQLRPYLDRCQILLVDGGSQDRTLSLIDPAFTLLHSPKGRACQMNYGAAHSHGDVLFFLHSDSKLPPDFLGEIKEVMNIHQAGCFGITFPSSHFFLWTCKHISNLRARFGRIMFGDQGIFIDRQLFYSMGGFPDLPIMEDYQFSLSLKEKQIAIGMTRHRICTSDRRFPKGTLAKLRTMGQMQWLRKLYRDGVDIHVIAQRYKDIRS